MPTLRNKKKAHRKGEAQDAMKEDKMDPNTDVKEDYQMNLI